MKIKDYARWSNLSCISRLMQRKFIHVGFSAFPSSHPTSTLTSELDVPNNTPAWGNLPFQTGNPPSTDQCWPFSWYRGGELETIPPGPPRGWSHWVCSQSSWAASTISLTKAFLGEKSNVAANRIQPDSSYCREKIAMLRVQSEIF